MFLFCAFLICQLNEQRRPQHIRNALTIPLAAQMWNVRNKQLLLFCSTRAYCPVSISSQVALFAGRTLWHFAEVFSFVSRSAIWCQTKFVCSQSYHFAVRESHRPSHARAYSNQTIYGYEPIRTHSFQANIWMGIVSIMEKRMIPANLSDTCRRDSSRVRNTLTSRN